MRGQNELYQELRPDLVLEEFAKVFRIHITTARRWIAEGRIRAIRLPGGRYRIPADEVDRLRQPCQTTKSMRAEQNR